MLINEVCKKCDLTKKAIEYYESQNLISPQKDTNGYRIFTDEDIKVLSEISLFRKLDISISDIKSILTDKDKTKVLKNCKTKMEVKLNQIETQYNCLSKLIEEDYNISDALDYVNENINSNKLIKDKLKEAFPGNFGVFIYLHFSMFLNEKIDTDEKAAAYQNIIDFLDNLENMEFPEQLAKSLTEAYEKLTEEDLGKMNDSMTSVADNYDDFISQNEDILKTYLEYRNSDEFCNSDAYKMQQLLIDFQKQSGYTDIFIPNMRILSDSYNEYLNKMQTINEKFIADYPEAKNLYK